MEACKRLHLIVRVTTLITSVFQPFARKVRATLKRDKTSIKPSSASTMAPVTRSKTAAMAKTAENNIQDGEPNLDLPTSLDAYIDELELLQRNDRRPSSNLPLDPFDPALTQDPWDELYREKVTEYQSKQRRPSFSATFDPSLSADPWGQLYRTNEQDLAATAHARIFNNWTFSSGYAHRKYRPRKLDAAGMPRPQSLNLISPTAAQHRLAHAAPLTKMHSCEFADEDDDDEVVFVGRQGKLPPKRQVEGQGLPAAKKRKTQLMYSDKVSQLREEARFESAVGKRFVRPGEYLFDEARRPQ